MPLTRRFGNSCPRPSASKTTSMRRGHSSSPRSAPVMWWPRSKTVPAGRTHANRHPGARRRSGEERRLSHHRRDEAGCLSGRVEQGRAADAGRERLPGPLHRLPKGEAAVPALRRDRERSDTRLAAKLCDLLLAVELAKKGWQLAGVGWETIEVCSRRTAESTTRPAARHRRPGKAGGVGDPRRGHKAKRLSLTGPSRDCRGRLGDDESEALDGIKERLGSRRIDHTRAAVRGAKRRRPCRRAAECSPEADAAR